MTTLESVIVEDVHKESEKPIDREKVRDCRVDNSTITNLLQFRLLMHLDMPFAPASVLQHRQTQFPPRVHEWKRSRKRITDLYLVRTSY
jgi:hypothetical protein